MSEAGDPLYGRALLRLAADAAGAGRLEAADGTGSAHNPACGDHVAMEVALAGGRIASIAHQTRACILTQASAAALSRAAPGLDRAGVAALEAAVRDMLKNGAVPPLPDFAAFDAAAAHAGRHVCVLLPFRALGQALENGETNTSPHHGRP